MKAIIKATKAPGLVMSNIDVPVIHDDEVLIRIKSTGICGTDLHIYEWTNWAKRTIPVPLTIGHEFMGEIAKLGRNVSHLKVGERVSGEGHINCGTCRQCCGIYLHLCPNLKGLGIKRAGSFAEYLSLPAKNVIKIPNNISDDVAAILDPLGNAVHTALGFELAGEDVFITGAGPIGLMTVAIAKKVGARFIAITDVNDYRLNLAKKLGANLTINIGNTPFKDQLKVLDIKPEFSVGFEMSGHEAAIESQLEILIPGAKLALLGIPPHHQVTLDWDLIIFKGLEIKGIYGREIFETWRKMLALLDSGLDIAPIITHHFKATDFEEAFKVAQSGNAGKVILHWD